MKVHVHVHSIIDDKFFLSIGSKVCNRILTGQWLGMELELESIIPWDQIGIGLSQYFQGWNWNWN